MKIYSAACLLFVLSVTASADWNVGPNSQVNFVSVKKNSIAEVHRLEEISGSLADSGEFAVEIDLGSVESGIPIRNERMQQYLFEVDTFPKAKVSGKIEPKTINNIKRGEPSREQLMLTVNMHGNEKSYQVPVQIVKFLDGSLSVRNVQPLIVYAADFGLDPGIAKLAELAGLPSIASAVPVNFSLNFSKDK